MAKKIRIGVIGCGFIGHYHARAVAASEQAELVAAADSNPAALERFAALFPGVRTTLRFEELASMPDLDAVAIGIPNARHAPTTDRLLKAGKHVLLEKPMALNAAEAAIIARTARQKGVRLQIGHCWRYDTEVNFLKQLVQQGTLGRIVKTKGYGIHTNWGPAGWFTRKAEAGGGALVDMGIHAIDTASYLLGDPAPLSVYAKIGTHYGSYDVDDTGVIVIEWQGGAVSVVESGWWQPHMDGPEAGTQLYGTLGYAQLFPTLVKLSLGSARGCFQPEFPPRVEHCEQAMYNRQMEAFVQAIRTRKPPRPDGELGTRIMKILDACYRSSRTGGVVRPG